MCDAAVAHDPRGTSSGFGTLGNSAAKIRTMMDLLLAKWAERQTEEIGVDDVRSAVAGRHARNKEATVQSEWQTSPFPPRRHERLRGDDRRHVVGGGLSGPDARRVDRDLRTSIPDRVVGAL